MQKERLSGVWVAMITPFKDGKVDFNALERHTEWLIEGGVDGLLVLGTTGEAVALSADERVEVFNAVKSVAAGRKPIMVGVGTNNTEETVANARKFSKLGADALLVVVPPYNKPTQRGMIAHFTAVADASEVPVVLYNVPSRTGSNLLPETVERLAEHPRIVAIKEASGNVGQFMDLVRRVGEKLVLLSGDDALFYPFLALGGDGVVSVVANVAPAETEEIWLSWQKGDVDSARAAHYKLLPLMRAMFVETNPIPCKYALSVMGRMTDEVRLPLATLAEESKRKVEEAMRKAGVL